MHSAEKYRQKIINEFFTIFNAFISFGSSGVNTDYPEPF